MNRRTFLGTIPFLVTVAPLSARVAYGSEEELPVEFPQFFRWVSLEGGNKQLGFEDLWDPQFQTQCRSVLRQSCQNNAIRGRVALSVEGQIPALNLTQSRLEREMDWVSFTRQLPRQAPGKRQYVRYLLHRYGDNLNRINQRYGTRAKRASDLLHHPFVRVNWQNRQIFKDDQVFLQIMRNRWDAEFKSLQTTASAHGLHLFEESGAKTELADRQSRFAII
ncbi:MAG: hypothetical protein P8L44_16640 [Opitutales bacterium]|nr:hypothetical protein [Opitutales bacterium]